jgi:hypothetical protein
VDPAFGIKRIETKKMKTCPGLGYTAAERIAVRPKAAQGAGRGIANAILLLPEGRARDCSGNPFLPLCGTKDWSGKPGFCEAKMRT